MFFGLRMTKWLFGWATLLTTLSILVVLHTSNLRYDKSVHIALHEGANHFDTNLV